LTEHQKRWSEEALSELPRDLLVFNEREYDYHQGHIIVLGAPVPRRWTNVEQLREQVLEAGGLMILAHPFRFYPSGLSLLYPMWHEPGEWPPERLAGHRMFDQVDAVEAWNYRATRAQNELAEACAKVRGLPIVAGSDSHAAEDIGRYATEFDDEIESLAGLLAAIRAGRCRPVELSDAGEYVPLVRTTGVLLERG
jgi:predicted metal-dependent phosphoesterase TrpH